MFMSRQLARPMQYGTGKLLVIVLLLGVITMPVRANDGGIVEGHNQHARTGNAFAKRVLALHQNLIARTGTTRKTRVGGYANYPDFYLEENWFDANGQHVSRVLWERDQPQNLHTIEVFIRDEQGRVLRDYLAAYLPDYRNAPTQTQVTLYRYNGELTAFRGFDAYGDAVVERCTGRLQDKEVSLLLDEDEIYEARVGRTDMMKRAEYQACFAGLPEKAGKFLTPQ